MKTLDIDLTLEPKEIELDSEPKQEIEYPETLSFYINDPMRDELVYENAVQLTREQIIDFREVVLACIDGKYAWGKILGKHGNGTIVYHLGDLSVLVKSDNLCLEPCNYFIGNYDYQDAIRMIKREFMVGYVEY